MKISVPSFTEFLLSTDCLNDNRVSLKAKWWLVGLFLFELIASFAFTSINQIKKIFPAPAKAFCGSDINVRSDVRSDVDEAAMLVVMFVVIYDMMDHIPSEAALTVPEVNEAGSKVLSSGSFVAEEGISANMVAPVFKEMCTSVCGGEIQLSSVSTVGFAISDVSLSPLTPRKRHPLGMEREDRNKILRSSWQSSEEFQSPNVSYNFVHGPPGVTEWYLDPHQARKYEVKLKKVVGGKKRVPKGFNVKRKIRSVVNLKKIIQSLIHMVGKSPDVKVSHKAVVSDFFAHPHVLYASSSGGSSSIVGSHELIPYSGFGIIESLPSQLSGSATYVGCKASGFVSSSSLSPLWPSSFSYPCPSSSAAVGVAVGTKVRSMATKRGLNDDVCATPSSNNSTNGVVIPSAGGSQMKKVPSKNTKLSTAE